MEFALQGALQNAFRQDNNVIHFSINLAMMSGKFDFLRFSRTCLLSGLSTRSDAVWLLHHLGSCCQELHCTVKKYSMDQKRFYWLLSVFYEGFTIFKHLGLSLYKSLIAVKLILSIWYLTVMLFIGPRGLVHTCEALSLWITDRWNREHCESLVIERFEWKFCFCAETRYIYTWRNTFLKWNLFFPLGVATPMIGWSTHTRKGAMPVSIA